MDFSGTWSKLQGPRVWDSMTFSMMRCRLKSTHTLTVKSHCVKERWARPLNIRYWRWAGGGVRARGCQVGDIEKTARQQTRRIRYEGFHDVFVTLIIYLLFYIFSCVSECVCFCARVFMPMCVVCSPLVEFNPCVQGLTSLEHASLHSLFCT